MDQEEIIEGQEVEAVEQSVMDEVNALVASAMEGVTEDMTKDEAIDVLIQALEASKGGEEGQPSSVLGGLGDTGGFELPEDEN